MNFDIGIISLIISVVVSAVQVLGYFDKKNARKELNTAKYALAAEVDRKAEEIQRQIDDLSSNIDKYSELQVKYAVLEERTNNISHSLDKIALVMEEIRRELNDKE